jgi:tRNA (cmo5U34)-methyltransferase
MTSRLKKVKNHFESEAGIYDENVVKVIPYYKEMLDALILNLPFPQDKELKIIDLGCGTGTLPFLIKSKFPNARIICLDFAESMIKAAQEKLKNFSGIEFELADITHYDFKDKYDAVVSSLALHHLETDQDKKDFYQKIYSALNENGIFINADIKIASNELFQKTSLIKWEEFMSHTLSKDEIQGYFNKYRTEDRPVVITDELIWLKEIGFRQIDVFWKYYNFAVYGGMKLMQ